MSAPADIETLRSIFADRRTHVAVGKVVKLGLASDRSVLRAQCRVLTQERDVVARVCWDACGPNSGSFQFPQVDDLVLLEFSEGDDNQVYLTKRLSNKTDKIPAQATGGHMVHRALSGKKLYLCSDEAILIGSGGASDPSEAMVLGDTLKTLLDNLIDTVNTALGAIASGPVGLGNLGAPVPTDAALASALNSAVSDLEDFKSTYLTTEATNILSQLAFTERGD